MNKPNPKPRKQLPYDYNRKPKPVRTPAELLAAEYAELRTRSPGGRG